MLLNLSFLCSIYRSLLGFLASSFGNCIVCPDIYSLWLLFWQLFLYVMLTNHKHRNKHGILFPNGV
jgi:hypothetical protein